MTLNSFLHSNKIYTELLGDGEAQSNSRKGFWVAASLTAAFCAII